MEPASLIRTVDDDLVVRGDGRTLFADLSRRFDDLGTGIVASDLHGQLIYANSAFGELVGLDCKRLLGIGPPFPWWLSGMHEIYEQKIGFFASGTARKFGVYGASESIRHSSGRQISVWIHYSRVINRAGRGLGHIARYVSENLAGRFPDALAAGRLEPWTLAGFSELPPRAREVLQHILQGRRVTSIARLLHLSPHTIRNHLKSIFQKFGVSSQTELMEKLIPPPEEELRSRFEYLDAILLNMPVGIAILEGPELRYFRINETLAEINGLPVEDHLGRPLAEVLPAAAPSIVPRMLEVLESGQPSPHHEFSTRLPKDPDRIRYFTDSFFPIAGVDGKPRAVGAIVLDTTERKLLEQDILDISERERRRVGQDL